MWKLFARLCDTIAVFVYQGSIFYVQKWFYETQLLPNADETVYTLVDPDNLYIVWIYIEVITFYLYMMSAMAYICYH